MLGVAILLILPKVPKWPRLLVVPIWPISVKLRNCPALGTTQIAEKNWIADIAETAEIAEIAEITETAEIAKIAEFAEIAEFTEIVEFACCQKCSDGREC